MSQPAKLVVRIRQQLGEFRLHPAFEVPASGVTALFGPSGAGKTQTLRALAGLNRPTRAVLRLGQTTWQDEQHWVPPQQRRIGYLFQEPSLFTHLDVAGNINYGLKRNPGSAGQDRRDALIDLLELGPLLGRRPQTLSGGEQQRVAIARALAPVPSLLLLDEPLSALDRQRKERILPFFDRLFAELDIPVILVSHDQDEVARLADQLVLIEDGRVSGTGPVETMLTDPALPLAEGLDASALLRGSVTVLDREWGLASVRVGSQTFTVPAGDLATGQAVRLRILARDVSLALSPPAQSSILNVIPVRVTGLRTQHPLVLVQLELGDGTRLLSRISARSANTLALNEGLELYAQVKAIALLD